LKYKLKALNLLSIIIFVKLINFLFELVAKKCCEGVALQMWIQKEGFCWTFIKLRGRKNHFLELVAKANRLFAITQALFRALSPKTTGLKTFELGSS